MLARSNKVVGLLHVRWYVPTRAIDVPPRRNLRMASEDGRLGRPCCLVEQNLENMNQITEPRILGDLQDGRCGCQICMTVERAEESDEGRSCFFL